MRIALALSLVVGVVLSGCHAHSSVKALGPGMNPRREGNLREAASRELACPNDQLVTSFVESIEGNAHIYRVTGCSKTYDSILFCLMGTCSWTETPEKRAAFDLQCPQEQLKRTYLGNATFGMAGCGKTVSYLYVNGRLVGNVAGMQAAPVAQ
jgi:hypothetical protein